MAHLPRRPLTGSDLRIQARPQSAPPLSGVRTSTRSCRTLQRTIQTDKRLQPFQVQFSAPQYTLEVMAAVGAVGRARTAGC